jgi:nitrogen regulatory protein PII
MKLVLAVVAAFKLDEIKQVLHALGTHGMTVTEVSRWSRCVAGEDKLIPCVKLEIVVHDDLADRVVAEILGAARNGHPVDGQILVTRVDAALGIRTGMIDEAAIA